MSQGERLTEVPGIEIYTIYRGIASTPERSRYVLCEVGGCEQASVTANARTADHRRCKERLCGHERVLIGS